MPKYRTPDANQKEIVRRLRELGYLVAHTHAIGKGAPDILVGGWARNRDQGTDISPVVGESMLLWCEIKTEKGKLTDDEAEFHRKWAGLPVVVVRSAEDVLRWFERP